MDNTNPGRHCAIKETGIERRLRLFRSLPTLFSSNLSFSLYLNASLRRSTTSRFARSPALQATGQVYLRRVHKSAPIQLLGPTSRKILITKYDIMGASPAKYNTMFMQRINRCYEHVKKYRPASSERDTGPLVRADYCNAVQVHGPSQRADVPPRTHGSRARSLVLITPRERFTFQISSGIDFSKTRLPNVNGSLLVLLFDASTIRFVRFRNNNRVDRFECVRWNYSLSQSSATGK